MWSLPWSLLALLFACTLQAQPRAQLPDPVSFPENRWVDLGRLDNHDLAADREALSAETNERQVWVRLHGAEQRDSCTGLFIYNYYTVDCGGGRFRYHMRQVGTLHPHQSRSMHAESANLTPCRR